METKYVEDFYTTEGMTDDEAIQAAVDDLNDGDTLLFKNGKIYVLNRPIYFTSYVFYYIRRKIKILAPRQS